jgi:hypothetical protein
MATFDRECTRGIVAKDAQPGPANQLSQHKVFESGGSQQPQNRVRAGAALSSRSPRLPGVPVLLQFRLQFARNTVQLLSRGREMRARPSFFADFALQTLLLPLY